MIKAHLLLKIEASFSIVKQNHTDNLGMKSRINIKSYK